MFFSCCKSTTPVVDDVSIQKALQARRGNVVIATVGTDSKTTDCHSLGLVLKLVPQPQDVQEQEQEQTPKHNFKPTHAIVVDSIHPESPLQHTPLKPGMVLFQINNINIENQSLNRIEHFLRTATVRPLRLWAQVPNNMELTATDSATETSKVTAKETHHHSGDSHNSFSNQPNRKPASKISSNSPNKTILAVAHKEEVNQSLGISLRRSDSGKFVIDKIDPSSPFYPHETSLLREEMIVTSINGLSITGMGMAVALSAMEDAPNSVLIVAELPADMEEPPIIRKRIVATIYKNSPDAKLGLSLVRIPNSSKNRKFRTVVSRIAPYCPFRETNLEVGMEITSVNGMDVSKSSPREILHYLQECGGKIVILAEMDVPAEESICTSAASVSHSTLSSSSRTPSHQDLTSQHAEHLATNSRNSGNTKTTSSSTPHQHASVSSREEGHVSTENPPSLASSTTRTPLSLPQPTAPPHFPELKTATVIKQIPDHPLGIALDEASPGVFFVSQISRHSPFCATPLQAGAQVIRINGVQLSGVDMAFVQMLLYKVVGEVVIEFLLPSDEEW